MRMNHESYILQKNSDYALVKEMISRLSERDKIQLKNELISEFRMKELESFAYQVSVQKTY